MWLSSGVWFVRDNEVFLLQSIWLLQSNDRWKGVMGKLSSVIINQILAFNLFSCKQLRLLFLILGVNSCSITSLP